MKPTLQKIAELLEDGDGPGLTDLLAPAQPLRRLTLEEVSQLEVIVRWVFVEQHELRQLLQLKD